jgi:hypothetical protein
LHQLQTVYNYIYVLRINEVPFVPDIHIVLLSFEIVWPYSGFDKGSGSIITKVVNGKGKLSKVNRGFRIKLIKSDFSDGCSEHVSDIPPRENEGR